MFKNLYIINFCKFLYANIFLRFSRQIRDPYLIKIDDISADIDTNQLKISYHIVNKRVYDNKTVDEFVKDGLIYLVDPRIVFELGQQYGSHSEKLILIKEKTKSSTLKMKCLTGLKRVFIDE
jgi:hypothetical protein